MSAWLSVGDVVMTKSKFFRPRHRRIPARCVYTALVRDIQSIDETLAKVIAVRLLDGAVIRDIFYKNGVVIL